MISLKQLKYNYKIYTKIYLDLLRERLAGAIRFASAVTGEKKNTRQVRDMRFYVFSTS